MATMKVAALIPFRNESRMLPCCMESLRGVADMVVGMDDHSSDHSGDIVRDKGGIVLETQGELSGFSQGKEKVIRQTLVDELVVAEPRIFCVWTPMRCLLRRSALRPSAHGRAEAGTQVVVALAYALGQYASLTAMEITASSIAFTGASLFVTLPIFLPMEDFFICHVLRASDSRNNVTKSPAGKGGHTAFYGGGSVALSAEDRMVSLCRAGSSSG